MQAKGYILLSRNTILAKRHLFHGNRLGIIGIFLELVNVKHQHISLNLETVSMTFFFFFFL